jgi:hypothetical protein
MNLCFESAISLNDANQYLNRTHPMTQELSYNFRQTQNANRHWLQRVWLNSSSTNTVNDVPDDCVSWPVESGILALSESFQLRPVWSASE